jgi:hypothetical protein
LALQALVAPIYWCCEHRSTNILVLPAHVAPIYWCYNVRSTNILVLRVLAAPISAHTGLFTTWWSVQFLADFFTIINYRTPCFLYGDHPTPSPVTGRDQWEFRGGGHSLYIRWDLAPLPPPPPSVNLPIIIVKGMVLQIEKYLKKRSAANICSTTPYRSNYAYSICCSKRKRK